MTTPPVEQVLIELSEKATPGPWVRGYWSGQCHIDHGTPAHPGRPECKYDPYFSPWPSEWHLLANPNIADSEVTGNFEMESGGVIRATDSDLIATTRNLIEPLAAVVAAAREVLAATPWDSDYLVRIDALRDALVALDKAGAA